MSPPDPLTLAAYETPPIDTSKVAPRITDETRRNTAYLLTSVLVLQTKNRLPPPSRASDTPRLTGTTAGRVGWIATLAGDEPASRSLHSLSISLHVQES